MQQGIAWHEKRDMSDICRSKHFSLVIDETTDIAVEQCLAVVVRYYDEEVFKVVDGLLDMIEVGDVSGEGLYNSIKQLLDEHNLPLSNIIGFASGNCATMTGGRSGFQAK